MAAKRKPDIPKLRSKVKTCARIVFSLKRPFPIRPADYEWPVYYCQPECFELTWIAFGLSQGRCRSLANQDNLRKRKWSCGCPAFKGREIDAPTPAALTAMIYPNPMRGNTNIEIKSNAKSAVEICIYNLKGQMVRNIESSELAKGKTSFVWDGKTDDGRTVSQGIYFCKIKSPNNVLTKKLIVIK